MTLKRMEWNEMKQVITTEFILLSMRYQSSLSSPPLYASIRSRLCFVLSLIS